METNKLYHHSENALQEERDQILRAKENPAAFEVLYRKYYVQIFRYIIKRVGDENDAATLTSDTFVKAMQALHKYEFKGVPFSAWLYQIARNELNLLFRKQKRTRVVTLETAQLEDVCEELEEPKDEGQLSLLMDGLNELEAEELEILEMRYFEKRPFKEVSEILGISEGNAKVRMHRVLTKLKKIVLAKAKR